MTGILDVFREVVDGLDSLQIDYLVGGSFASSLWGRPRQTNDLDLVLRLSRAAVSMFVEQFSPGFVVSPGEIEEALESKDSYPSFQLLHEDAVFKVDCFIADSSEFTESEFARRVKVAAWPDLGVWYASAEDVVLRKILWYELGNRVSDRQWNDLVQVIEARADEFDRKYFLDWAGRLGIFDLATSALSECASD